MADKLSKHFLFQEFIRSNTAEKRGIRNKPSLQHIINATAHAHVILEPLRAYLDKPIIITSWYRSPELNAAVGGSKTSTHMTGAATDIRISGMTPGEIIEAIKNLKLPTDQCLDEGFHRGDDWISWAHVASPKDFSLKPRGEILLARGDRSNPTYTVA